VEGAGNPKLLRGSPNVVEASPGVQLLRVPTGVIDRSMGDVHPLGNPHYTLDPSNIPLVTSNIVAGLTRVVPELAAPLELNRVRFLEALAPIERRWRATLAPFRGAPVVSYHDSWPYFYQAFGLVDGGVIEDRPGIPPSPQHLVSLIRRMSEQRAKIILLENWYPADVANLVARKTGAEEYVAHMDYLVRAVADNLR